MVFNFKMVETFRSSQEVYRVNKSDLLNILDIISIQMRDESSRRRNEGGHQPLYRIYLENGNAYRGSRMLLEDVEGSQLEIKADQREGESLGILGPTTLGIIEVVEGDDIVEFSMHRKKDLAINPSPIYDLIEQYVIE